MSLSLRIGQPCVMLLLGAAQTLFGQAERKPSEQLDEFLQLLSTPIQVASSRAEALMWTPSTVTILDRSTMDAHGVRTVEDALNLAAGVQVWGSPSKRRSLATIRGILQDNYSSKVLILVDGVPTFHGSIGDGYFFRMDAAALERVEVLRGPASVLYGSNAYAGAVNLVLRKGKAEGEAYATLGNRGSSGGGAWLALHSPFDLLVSGSLDRLQGKEFLFRGADGGSAPLADRDQNSTVTASLGQAGHRLLINAFRETKAYLGTDSSFATGAGLDDRYQGVLLAYTFEREVSKGWKIRFGATHDRASRMFYRAIAEAEKSSVDGYRNAFFLRSSWDLGSGWAFEVGGDQDRRKSLEYTHVATATGASLTDYHLQDVENTEKSALAQLNYATTRFSLVLGTRYTRNDLAGSDTASRLTLVFPIDPRNSLKFIAGQSYRAPTLFEQFFSRYGNPAVQPEKADTLELVYLTATDKLFAQGTLYTSTYKGKIFRSRTDPTSPNDLTVKYINGGDFKATGFELELKYKNPSLFDAFLSTDVLLATNAGDAVLQPTPTDHYNFKYVPRITAKAGLSSQWGDWGLAADGNWMSGAKGTGLHPPSIGSQGVLNLHGSFTQGWGRATVKHSLSLRNLGDKEVLFANYVNPDQPALSVIPLESRGRLIRYTFSARF